MSREQYKDKVSHGQTTFPLQVWFHNFSHSGKLCPYHWHDELEFVHILKGQCIFQIDNKLVEVKAGQAIFINSGILHTDHRIYFPYESFSIVFNSNIVCSSVMDVSYTKYIHPITQNSLFPYLLIDTDYSDILRQFIEIANLYKYEPIGYELMIKGHLNIALAHLVKEFEIHASKDAPCEENEKTFMLKNVLLYIENNYSDKIEVKDLAEHVNVSERYIQRIFKELTGRSPIDYINYYRIAQAQKLLAQHEKKITYVAMKVGFNNVSYFVKTFKRYTGHTPSTFRDNLESG